VSPERRAAALSPVQVRTALAPESDAETERRDLVEIAVVQIAADGSDHAVLGKIQLTPRPNLIRITDAELVDFQDGTRGPPDPIRFTRFVGDGEAFIRGGNPQFVLRPTRGTTRPVPNPIAAGVYFSPKSRDDTPNLPTPESIFDYATDIAIPGQPVQFLAREVDSPLRLGENEDRAALDRTNDHGIASTRVVAGAGGRRMQEGGTFDVVIASYADISGIEAAIVGGRTQSKAPRLLNDEQVPITAFNERDPNAPDERLIEGDPLPEGGLDPLDSSPAALQRRANVLQASPFYSSYPNSATPDPLRPVGQTFRSGKVLFNVVPLPGTGPIKNIHIAPSADARKAVMRINDEAQGEPFDAAEAEDVLKGAADVVRRIWHQRYGFPVDVRFHATPDGLPRQPGSGITNVLVMSARSGIDRGTFRQAAERADQTQPPRAGQSLAEIAQQFLDEAVELPRRDPNRDIPQTPPTTQKGITPFAGNARNPLGVDVNIFTVKPSGAQEPRPVGCFIAVEGFRHVQNNLLVLPDVDHLATYMANVIAHEYGHTLGFLEPWVFSPLTGTRQHTHAPFRRNRVIYELYRHQLMEPGTVFAEHVRTRLLDLEPIERQYLKEVFGGR
jgi:hypothetical protein